jgi:hypothetical protein
MKRIIAFVLFPFIFLKGYAQQIECKNCTDSITWKDIEGEKVVKVKVITKGEFGSKNWDSRIYGTLYLRDPDSLRVINSVKEYANFLNGILYMKNGLINGDFDNDKIIESYFFYEVAVDGLDDNTLKLICFYKKNKIVVLGNVPKQSERITQIKFKTKGFESIPKSVSGKLIDMWNKEAKKRMNKYISELE